MENKIPKIIHYCWFGKNPESDLMKKCLESWKKYLPDYELYLWNEETFDINSNMFTKEAYENKKWAFITDYVRLYALKNYGGIYMDTDVEVLKNLDEFLKFSAFSGFEDERYIPTGIMASQKNHIWIEKLFQYYENKHFQNKDGKLEVTPNTKIITKISEKLFNLKINNKRQTLKYNVEIFPKDYFCPKNHYSGKVYLTKNSYTIHHFNGSWMNNTQKIKKNLHSILISMFGEKNHMRILKLLKNN